MVRNAEAAAVVSDAYKLMTFFFCKIEIYKYLIKINTPTIIVPVSAITSSSVKFGLFFDTSESLPINVPDPSFSDSFLRIFKYTFSKKLCNVALQNSPSRKTKDSDIGYFEGAGTIFRKVTKLGYLIFLLVRKENQREI